MRLWHYKLIPFLPNSQLIAQWRELNSIFTKQPKHILINYVYEYDYEHLLQYTQLVMDEFARRNFKIKSFDNMNNYFFFKADMQQLGKELYEGLTGKQTNFPDRINVIEPFPNHHTNRYLWQCFANLQEKYDRGQKDFDEKRYESLENFMQKQGVATIL